MDAGCARPRARRLGRGAAAVVLACVLSGCPRGGKAVPAEVVLEWPDDAAARTPPPPIDAAPPDAD